MAIVSIALVAAAIILFIVGAINFLATMSAQTNVTEYRMHVMTLVLSAIFLLILAYVLKTW